MKSTRWRLVRQIFSGDKGATAVEYGLIMALMTIALIAALSGTGGANTKNWNKVSSEVSSVM